MAEQHPYVYRNTARRRTPLSGQQSFVLQCAAVFVVAIAVRLSIATALGVFHFAPGGEMFNVARSIATTGVFGSPNGAASGPTAHVAPVYPYLLAGILKLTTDLNLVSTLTTSFSIVVASLVWALLPAVTGVLGLPRRVGLIAGSIGAVSPLRYLVELNGYWDTTLSGLCVMLMTAVTVSVWNRRVTSRNALTLGAGWSFVCLLQPAAVVVLVVLLVVTVIRGGATRETLRTAGLVLLAFALILTPWTIRNYRTFGGVMFVRGNLGMELSVSNNDGALPSHHNVLRNPQARHPHVSAAEFAKRNEMGEWRYDQSRRREALSWMAANPVGFATLTLRRVRLFWVPERGILPLSILEWMLTAFAAAGLVSLARSRAPCVPLIVGLWMLYPALYYVVQADERFRYPIEWTIVIAAAVGIAHLLDLYRSRSAPMRR